MIHRRDFLVAGAGLLVAGSQGRAAERRKRIAFLGTEVRRHSHAQHFLDRFTQGYTWQGRWQQPRVHVASVYLDQFPQGDLGRQRIARHKLRQCSSIAEALTLSGPKLAVDGVVIIAEHGKYPRNEKGQTLYPRYKWFKEVVESFEETGRVVPGFNDSPEELTGIARFLAGIHRDIPWHVTAFHADYRMQDRRDTTVADLDRARAIGVDAGLRFVYAGNRLHDSIGIFSVGPNGDLTFIGEVWTRGNYPRSFNFDTAGQFLYCCNQRGDNITVFQVDRKTGGLSFTGHYTPVGNPSIIVFLDLTKAG